MKTRSNRLPVTGLRSVHNARSRIYVAGSDPMFSRTSGSRTSRPEATIRLVPAFPDDEPAAVTNSPLTRQTVLDRLQTPLTRYHE
jgi:hypothetical protein